MRVADGGATLNMEDEAEVPDSGTVVFRIPMPCLSKREWRTMEELEVTVITREGAEEAEFIKQGKP